MKKSIATDKASACRDPRPSAESQKQYWDSWNGEVRAGEVTAYMQRLKAAALRRIERFDGGNRILEVGCGTGWLSRELIRFGDVTGVDLSPQAIDIASRRCVGATFLCGDFSEIKLPGPFDIVVTADTIAHVTDQADFINRISSQLRAGGMLILMSQNAYALKRSSWVRPVPGQIRHWPSLAELRSYLASDFDIEEITTAAPEQATDGIYRVFNSRRVLRGMYRVLGQERTKRLYEKMRLGSEWVIVARRH